MCKWKNKQHVLCMFNQILFSPQKEVNSNICYNVDESWSHYAKEKDPKQKDK